MIQWGASSASVYNYCTVGFRFSVHQRGLKKNPKMDSGVLVQCESYTNRFPIQAGSQVTCVGRQELLMGYCMKIDVLTINIILLTNVLRWLCGFVDLDERTMLLGYAVETCSCN